MNNPHPDIISELQWNSRVPTTKPYPEQHMIVKCNKCSADKIATLKWWRRAEEGLNGDWWIVENIEDVYKRNDSLCAKCLRESIALPAPAEELEMVFPAEWIVSIGIQ